MVLAYCVTRVKVHSSWDHLNLRIRPEAKQWSTYHMIADVTFWSINTRTGLSEEASDIALISVVSCSYLVVIKLPYRLLHNQIISSGRHHLPQRMSSSTGYRSCTNLHCREKLPSAIKGNKRDQHYNDEVRRKYSLNKAGYNSWKVGWVACFRPTCGIRRVMG